MYLHILSILFLTNSLLSCHMSQENTPTTEARIGSQSKATCQQNPEKIRSVASNIVFQSNDLGQTWEDVSAGLPEALEVSRVLVVDGEIILTAETKLLRSSTSAEAPHWKNELLQNLSITNIFHGKSGLYASSYDKGFFKEIPGANVWVPMHYGLLDKTVRSIMETADGTLFVGVESGLFKSVDGGNSWKQVLEGTGVNALAEAEDVLICATYEGLSRSTDGGEHWDLVLTEDKGAWNTKYIGNAIVSIAQGDGGFWKKSVRSNRLRLSTDKGKTWQCIDEGLTHIPELGHVTEAGNSFRSINDIEQLGKYLFCSTNTGIFRSDDMGKSWELLRRSNGKEMLELAVSGNRIYAIQVVGC